MAIFEFRKRDNVSELSVSAAEIDMYGEILSCMVTAVKPKVVHLHEPESL